MSLIDHFLPTYQFSERHHTLVRCGPRELLDIIQGYRPPRDRVADLFMFVRQIPANLLHRSVPARIPPSRPFTVANFVPLGRDGDSEIVAGLVGRFWRPDFGLVAIGGPLEFLAFDAPRTAKLAIGFLVEQAGNVTRLTTETRVHCPDRYAYMMFLPYWVMIRPASGLLRRRALARIRAIAETRATAGAAVPS